MVQEPAVWGKPGVEVGERLGPDPVQPTLRIDARLDQSRGPEDPQVLGDQGLADAKLAHEFADRPLPASQQLKDGDPARFGERL